MWFTFRSVAYAGLFLGYGFLMLLGMRHRPNSQRLRGWLQAVLLTNAAFTLALGLAALLAADRWWSYMWQRAGDAALVLLALLTAELADAFVDRDTRPWPRLAVSSLLLVAALGLDAAPVPVPALQAPWFGFPVGRAELTTALFFVAWTVAAGSAWWTTWTALRQTVGAKHRNRIRYLVVCVAGLTIGDLLILATALPDAYVGFAVRLLALSVVTYSLLHYNLPDLRRLTLSAMRILVLTTITASLYIVFLAAGLFLSNASLRMYPTILLLSPLAGAVFLAAALDVVFGPRLHERFERTVLGRHYNPQKALRAYSQQMSLLLDVDRVAKVTLDWLRNTLRVQRAAFIVLQREDGRATLSLVQATGFDAARNMQTREAVVFDAESRFLTHFTRQRRPLSQYDVDMLAWFHAMPDEERGWLRALGADLHVPVLLGDDLGALLALGPKQAAQPYSEEDQETLMLMAHQTANALENARLVGDLRAVQDDLNRLNTELAETNRQLQRLDRTKADFVTIASHELRTPLSQIFGYSDVLASLESEEMGDPQMLGEFIEGISRGARRLKRVVDAMVDVSLIETGGMRIRAHKMQLGVVVANAMATVQEKAGAREQHLVVDDLSSLPHLEADGARLEQVFECLLANAIKFTPDGGTIRVSARAEEASVELCVADEGIGVDPDQQDLIFEKFYRPENPMLHSTDDVGFKGAGPGLGLAIAKGIVEAHGGRIWVESAGRDELTCPGSTFCVRLPLVAGGQG